MIALLVALVLTGEGDFSVQVAAAAEELGCVAGTVWKAPDDGEGSDIRLVQFRCQQAADVMLVFVEHGEGDWYVAPRVFFPAGTPAGKPSPKAGSEI